MRKRKTIKELYEMTEEEVRGEIEKTAKSYITDGYNETTAYEIAKSDWSFWFNFNNKRI